MQLPWWRLNTRCPSFFQAGQMLQQQQQQIAQRRQSGAVGDLVPSQGFTSQPRTMVILCSNNHGNQTWDMITGSSHESEVGYNWINPSCKWINPTKIPLITGDITYLPYDSWDDPPSRDLRYLRAAFSNGSMGHHGMVSPSVTTVPWGMWVESCWIPMMVVWSFATWWAYYLLAGSDDYCYSYLLAGHDGSWLVMM